ncbi:MAG: hypothetical protein QFB87_00715 [Patescibacteria group bacterium]|nr:hypothetical protein [Patescibacteria group bacterium]
MEKDSSLPPIAGLAENTIQPVVEPMHSTFQADSTLVPEINPTIEAHDLGQNSLNTPEQDNPKSRFARAVGSIAVRTVEGLITTDDYTVIAVSGLYQKIAGRKLAKTNSQDGRKQISIAAHKEAAQAVIDHRVIKPGLEPATISQRKQAERASARQGKASIRQSGDQYRLRGIWDTTILRETAPGEDIKYVSIADSDFSEKIRAQLNQKRISGSTARRALKAKESYDRNEKFINKLSGLSKAKGLVHKSSVGRDIPGKLLERSAQKADKKTARIGSRLEIAEEISKKKRAAIKKRGKSRYSQP